MRYFGAVRGTARFASAIHALISYFTDHPDHARLLLRELLDHPEDIKALLEIPDQES